MKLLVDFYMRFGFQWKDSGQTRTTFIQNTYMFFQKVVRVLDERSSCFFWLWFLAFYTLGSSMVLLYGICIENKAFRLNPNEWVAISYTCRSAITTPSGRSASPTAYWLKAICMTVNPRQTNNTQENTQMAPIQAKTGENKDTGHGLYDIVCQSHTPIANQWFHGIFELLPSGKPLRPTPPTDKPSSD